MKKAHRKKGFTLIELLVVITIIGILAGIAFVGFGDVFSTAGRTTAQKNLKTVYEALAAKTRSFPMESSMDEASVEGFIVWWRNKTNDTRPALWFVGEDERVKDLLGDDSGPGLPSNISDEVGMEGEQKEALGYCVALPGDDAETKNFLTSLKSGAFPLIWSRGLDAGDDKWSADGTWGGDGGHVLFSDGTVKWFDDTKGSNEEGVFLTAINKEDGADKKAEPTNDIQSALPKGWTIHTPE
tara:strand:+ start:441 stop:1163 length:723 start_codon:yes stop_codon:yes gene_type:complete